MTTKELPNRFPNRTVASADAWARIGRKNYEPLTEIEKAKLDIYVERQNLEVQIYDEGLGKHRKNRRWYKRTITEDIEDPNQEK